MKFNSGCKQGEIEQVDRKDELNFATVSSDGPIVSPRDIL